MCNETVTQDNLHKAMSAWRDIRDIALTMQDLEMRELRATAELAMGRMTKILAKRLAGNVQEDS